MIDILHLIVQWCKTFLPSLLPSIVSMNDSWFLSSWIVNPKLFQGENYKPNSLPFEAWIATTYFLIASLSLIFPVSSTISGACSYFVFDLCCFFNNLRRVQLLFLWSSLLFLPQFQALAAASSLIFAVFFNNVRALESASYFNICCFFHNLRRLNLLLLWYLVFLRQSQVLAAASCWIFAVSSTTSGAWSFKFRQFHSWIHGCSSRLHSSMPDWVK